MILPDHPFTNTSKANALLALMCFQSSRLDARVNDKGEAILFDEQDETLWDKALIEKGNYYLIEACESNNSSVSKYHLEAGIAYWHTSSAEDKWQQILNLYNQLVIIEYSPVTALNRTFAFSKVYGNQKAIVEAEKLNLITSEYYHGLMGYLYSEINIGKAIHHYEEAIRLTKSKPEKQTLQKQIDLLCSK